MLYNKDNLNYNKSAYLYTHVFTYILCIYLTWNKVRTDTAENGITATDGFTEMSSEREQKCEDIKAVTEKQQIKQDRQPKTKERYTWKKRKKLSWLVE